MPRFDPMSIDRETLASVAKAEASLPLASVAKAEASLPSPLKAGLIVGGFGAVLGMLLGKDPLKWGLATGGLTFGVTLAADAGFEAGLAMGVLAAAPSHATGIAVPSYHGARRTNMPSPSSQHGFVAVAQPGYHAAGGMAPGFRGGGAPMNMPGPSSQHAFGWRSEHATSGFFTGADEQEQHAAAAAAHAQQRDEHAHVAAAHAAQRDEHAHAADNHHDDGARGEHARAADYHGRAAEHHGREAERAHGRFEHHAREAERGRGGEHRGRGWGGLGGVLEHFGWGGGGGGGMGGGGHGGCPSGIYDASGQCVLAGEKASGTGMTTHGGGGGPDPNGAPFNHQSGMCPCWANVDVFGNIQDHQTCYPSHNDAANKTNGFPGTPVDYQGGDYFSAAPCSTSATPMATSGFFTSGDDPRFALFLRSGSPMWRTLPTGQPPDEMSDTEWGIYPGYVYEVRGEFSHVNIDGTPCWVRNRDLRRSTSREPMPEPPHVTGWWTPDARWGLTPWLPYPFVAEQFLEPAWEWGRAHAADIKRAV